MDWPQPRDRLAIRLHIRTQLRSRGLLEFADDDEETARRTELVYLNCKDQWEEDALEEIRLPLEALQATTTDNAMQSIENTLPDNEEFWSSTGTSNSAAGEALLYRLRQPLGRVAYVSFAVYRAHYQHGDPLYPPRKVSFLTGPTPNQLYPASPIYPVRLTDEDQVLALSPTAPVSQYLMVRFHGRMQRQWEDLQFYIAIRNVGAYGTVLQPNYYTQVVRALSERGLAWPCTRGSNPTATASGGPSPIGQGDITYAASAAAQGALDGTGGGGGRRDAATRCDYTLPTPDVYEAGQPLSLDRDLRASTATSSSASSIPSWLTGWWHRKAAATSAAAPAGPPSSWCVQVGSWSVSTPPPTRTSQLLLGKMCSAAGSSEAAAGGAAVGARSGAGPAAVLTGPTGAEMQLIVGRAAIVRALMSLNRLPWPETLLVHGAEVAEVQPVSAPAPASVTNHPAGPPRDVVMSGVRPDGTTALEARAAEAEAEAGPEGEQAKVEAPLVPLSKGLGHCEKRSRLNHPSVAVKGFFSKLWHRPPGEAGPSSQGLAGGGSEPAAAAAYGNHGTCTTAAVAAERRATVSRMATFVAELSYWAAVQPVLSNSPVQNVIQRQQQQLTSNDGEDLYRSPQLPPQQQRRRTPPPPPQPPLRRNLPQPARHDFGPYPAVSRSRGRWAVSSGGGGGGSSAGRGGEYEYAASFATAASDSQPDRRAARRALQQAVFRPGRPAFVALREWATPDRQQAVQRTGSGGWLVSHYDHEHL